jgi:hypothetical protein
MFTIICSVIFSNSLSYAYTANYVDMRVLMNQTFYEANPGGISTAENIVNTAKYPFAQKWNIILNASYEKVGPLPVESCPLSNNTHCSASTCGSATSCTNSISNNIHHKNISKNLNIVKNSFSVSPYDLMTTFIGTYACSKNGSTHTFPAGVADVRGSYSICTFVSTATTNFKVRALQHEISHNFGCSHCQGYSTPACIMKGSYDLNTSNLSDIWCTYCENNYFDRLLH